MNTTTSKSGKVLQSRQHTITLEYLGQRHKSREALNIAAENALRGVSDDEALAVVGAVMLARIEVPKTLDDLAESILVSRRLTLRCIRAFLAMGQLEGLKLIKAG